MFNEYPISQSLNSENLITCTTCTVYSVHITLGHKYKPHKYKSSLYLQLSMPPQKERRNNTGILTQYNNSSFLRPASVE